MSVFQPMQTPMTRRMYGQAVVVAVTPIVNLMALVSGTQSSQYGVKYK